MSEQAPTKVYEKDKVRFERLRALPMTELLKQPVTDLPLAKRALSYCEKKNVATVGQLSKLERKVLLKARNMGRKTVAHIEAYLQQIGLGLDGRIAAEVPAAMPPAFARGAKAMHLAVLAQLSALGAPFELVQAISRMSLPTEE